jgi:hypothetical protein
LHVAFLQQFIRPNIPPPIAARVVWGLLWLWLLLWLNASAVNVLPCASRASCVGA